MRPHRLSGICLALRGSLGRCVACSFGSVSLEFADTFNLTPDGARLSRKQAGYFGGGVLSEGFGSGIVLHG